MDDAPDHISLKEKGNKSEKASWDMTEQHAKMAEAHSSTRCCATSKRSGLVCKAPAVKGWTVCRMHGAGGGAPEGKRNGMWRHGGRTKQTEEVRVLAKMIADWARRTAVD